MHTVAIVNQKGGVGKTAMTLGIASAIRSKGGRVLVIDLDPQANATSGLGASGGPGVLTSGNVLASGKRGIAVQAISATSWGDGVYCIPADVALAEREHETGRRGHEFRLRNSLEGVDGYDLALIDCQPSVGELVTNALVAADYALIVSKAEIDSLVGIENMLEIIQVIKQHYNGDLKVAGIAINDVDLRSGEQQFRFAELRRNYGDLVWEPHLPHRTRIADAKGGSVPIHDFGYRAKEAIAVYDALTERLLSLGNG